MSVILHPHALLVSWKIYSFSDLRPLLVPVTWLSPDPTFSAINCLFFFSCGYLPSPEMSPSHYLKIKCLPLCYISATHHPLSIYPSKFQIRLSPSLFKSLCWVTSSHSRCNRPKMQVIISRIPSYHKISKQRKKCSPVFFHCFLSKFRYSVNIAFCKAET